ncbi:MAG TPA: ATP-binding protein, partial [Polyangia bacterium]
MLLRLAGAATLAVAFHLVRKGRFRQGVILFLGGVVAICAIGVSTMGLEANRSNLHMFLAPLALAAMLVGRRALWASLVVFAAAFVVGGARDLGYFGSVGPPAPVEDPLGPVGSAIISFLVLTIMLDRVGLSLREGFLLAIGRQEELQRTTAELEDANHALRAEMARRQSAEAQLIEAQKMEAVTRLSGGVAHDFNNLLTVIMACTQLAKESLTAEENVRRALDDIEEAAGRAAELTRQLLAFARRQMVEPRVLQVEDRVLSTEKMLRRLLGEDIRLTTRLAEDNDWAVLIEPGQLDQVIVNFAVNARDAMPNGGPIEIRTRRQTLPEGKASAQFSLPPGDYVVLAVSDRGTGMDTETQRRVFEPFFTTKGGTRGTGLGLATCYGIVLQAGGGIFFETELGQGTTFEAYFPRATKGVPIATAGRSPAPPREGQGETVLLVDDEARVRQVTARILEHAGYTVLLAACVADAVAVIKATSSRIDLLITDVVLPDGSGRDVASQMLDLHPRLPVLYVSGYTGDSVLLRNISDKG